MGVIKLSEWGVLQGRGVYTTGREGGGGGALTHTCQHTKYKYYKTLTQPDNINLDNTNV